MPAKTDDDFLEFLKSQKKRRTIALSGLKKTESELVEFEQSLKELLKYLDNYRGRRYIHSLQIKLIREKNSLRTLIEKLDVENEEQSSVLGHP